MADIDRDTNLDIVIGTDETGHTLVFFNDGLGNFSTPRLHQQFNSMVESSDAVTKEAFEDINQDQIGDLVANDTDSSALEPQ